MADKKSASLKTHNYRETNGALGVLLCVESDGTTNFTSRVRFCGHPEVENSTFGKTARHFFVRIRMR